MSVSMNECITLIEPLVPRMSASLERLATILVVSVATALLGKTRLVTVVSSTPIQERQTRVPCGGKQHQVGEQMMGEIVQNARECKEYECFIIIMCTQGFTTG